jgi:hypothetical protein
MYMVRKSKFISLRFKNGLKWKLVWTVSQQVELSFIFLPPMQIAQILCTSFFFRKFIWKRFENMLKVKKCQKVWNITILIFSTNWRCDREHPWIRLKQSLFSLQIEDVIENILEYDYNNPYFLYKLKMW